MLSSDHVFVDASRGDKHTYVRPRISELAGRAELHLTRRGRRIVEVVPKTRSLIGPVQARFGNSISRDGKKITSFGAHQSSIRG